jgi:hypothetical protein
MTAAAEATAAQRITRLCGLVCGPSASLQTWWQADPSGFGNPYFVASAQQAFAFVG